MFNCRFCNTTSKPGEKIGGMVNLATREKEYPCRTVEEGKPYTTKGWETVKEVAACTMCFDMWKMTPNYARLFIHNKKGFKNGKEVQ